ncbi:MAG: hypothetical protein J6A08_05585 [Lachnospiraceae bacterium]|nr:hypothetical protein [Lachnospiraceae bacterium]
MDKYEYKVRADEIKALIAEGEFAEAVKIADTIDWRRVRSVMMLCTVSDLYKINRRYQESKDILLLAYEKHPTGRLIVYSLCELSIKMEEYVQAIEYYKEFVQIAPKDTGRYILQYRLYEAQDVSLEERIAVLEEFKKRDYREKWAYELAYLYHRIGLSTKCVEECDEMFLWFGEGKYVIKALELKALHEPLSAEQQAKYGAWIQEKDSETEEEAVEEETDSDAAEEEEDGISGDTRIAGDIRHTAPEEEPAEEQLTAGAPTMELPEVKPVDVGQYNTINLQMALAESMKEILEGDPVSGEEPAGEPEPLSAEEIVEEAADAEPEPIAEEEVREEAEEETEDEAPSIAESIIAPLLQETEKLPAQEEMETVLEETPQPVSKEMPVVPFPKKKEEEQLSAAIEPVNVKALVAETDDLQEVGAQGVKEDKAAFDAQQIMQQIRQEMVKPSAYDNILSQEYDGQISLVVPDAERVEKQITGQLSIDDIMAEWEEMKKSNEQKRMEDVRQHILAQTGSLFANFDEATKNGLLEELEKAFMAAILKESKKPPIKRVILPEDAAEEEPAPKEPVTKHSGKTLQPQVEEPSDDGVEELEEIEEPDASAGQEEEAGAVTETVKEKGTSPAPETENSDPAERELTEEEKELFGQFVHHRKSRRQLVHTLDNMSLAACTGNVVITGEEEITTLTLAKTLIREMQYNDNNFSGKVAKISGHILNKKDVAATFAKLDNGALIIEKASAMKPDTVAKMIKVLEKDNMGLLLLMTDTKAGMNQLLAEHKALSNNFNLRVDIEPLDDEALVAYARQYAEEMEYSIDEFGILALHTRISEKQTSDHEVSLAEVRELVDEAIYYANKKTPGHFMDILLAKRYDEEDMIVLREKDFMHYKN